MRFLDTSRIRTRFDVRVPARDATELSVDLYLPPSSGSYPVLLTRTAADNNRVGRPGISLPPAERWKAFAAHGYIVAAADVRGRGDSDGVFVPFMHEATDGADTLAWLRSLDECNGKIGMFGSGYGAFCAWAAAVADGNVGAIVSISPFGAVGRGLVHNGGAVRLDWLFWLHLVGGRSVQPTHVVPWRTVHMHTPLMSLADALGRDDIPWREWLERLNPQDPRWAPLDLADPIAGLNVPALHVTGWWDGQLNGARCIYEAARRSRASQQLIIGPWDTAAVRRPRAQVGGFDFGPRSLLDMDETTLKFFADCLREDRTADVEPATRVFVTGRNEWMSLDGWPAPGDSRLTLQLSSTFGANTRRGDGLLSTEFKRGADRDVVTHNPDVPVEFQPQFAGFAAATQLLNVTLEQAHITGRDEALVYTSEPLTESLLVLGPPSISFTVVTSAADADLYVLLSDTFPAQSRDLHLSHAAVRLGTLEGFAPNRPVHVRLALSCVGHEFLPRHQIRLVVTPSLFPLYARNLQGTDYLAGHAVTIAEIELLHLSSGPAQLTLSIAQSHVT